MKTVNFKRGDVYLINFPLPDVIGQTIHKFMVNLQEGKIIDHSRTMVGVIITTLKDSTPPTLYPTDVLLTPQESKTQYGAKVICNQIHTIDKSQIIDFKYNLSLATMQEINKKPLLGIGIIKIEDFQT
ncbi:type II toxin-antitoxin system PemK/MazF family toxin [candidate division KSB1 bacterium]|nr:type II toxin-antitoxin system PemK/MazF family toxin [candidate division KSB1 bacterium]